MIRERSSPPCHEKNTPIGIAGCLQPLLLAAFLSFGALTAASQTTGVLISQQQLLGNNGERLAMLPAGSSVQILGRKSETGEVIVSFQDPYGRQIIGMVPEGQVIETAGARPDSPGVSSRNTSGPSAVSPAAPPSQLDLSRPVPSTELSAYVKTDKTAASSELRGKRFVVRGVITAARMETNPGGGQSPVLTLEGAPNAPRVKVRLSPTIGRSREVFKNYTFFPDWFYDYYGKKLDFRNAGADRIEVRATAMRVVTWNDGSSSKYRESSDWSPLFSPGDPVVIEAAFKGAFMDIEMEGGFLISNR